MTSVGLKTVNPESMRKRCAQPKPGMRPTEARSSVSVGVHVGMEFQTNPHLKNYSKPLINSGYWRRFVKRVEGSLHSTRNFVG